LISIQPLSIPDDDAAESKTAARGVSRNDEQGLKQSLGPQRKHMTKQEKKAMRGANKGRRFVKTKDSIDLCWRVANGSECEYGPESVFTYATHRDILLTQSKKENVAFLMIFLPTLLQNLGTSVYLTPQRLLILHPFSIHQSPSVGSTQNICHWILVRLVRYSLNPENAGLFLV
jgi:hypothetical protein